MVGGDGVGRAVAGRRAVVGRRQPPPASPLAGRHRRRRRPSAVPGWRPVGGRGHLRLNAVCPVHLLNLASHAGKPAGDFRSWGTRMRTTMRRLLAAGVLATMVGACAASEATGPATASPAVQVNRVEKILPLTRDEEAPALLVDKDDP